MNLALFRRIKKYLPVWSRVTFYNSYIAPHIDYCITIWGSSSDITRLSKLQKHAAHIILDSDISVPSKDLFNKLKWMPIPDWKKFRKVFTVYKALNGLHPQYIVILVNHYDVKTAILHDECQTLEDVWYINNL